VVLDEWNGDGAYVEHRVGKDGLLAWVGSVGPQRLSSPNLGSAFRGGTTQVWVPRHTLEPAGPPIPTAWNGGTK
jgi:hypothetical protein